MDPCWSVLLLIRNTEWVRFWRWRIAKPLSDAVAIVWCSYCQSSVVLQGHGFEMKSEISWAWGCRCEILGLGSPRQEEPQFKAVWLAHTDCLQTKQTQEKKRLLVVSQYNWYLGLPSPLATFPVCKREKLKKKIPNGVFIIIFTLIGSAVLVERYPIATSWWEKITSVFAICSFPLWIKFFLLWPVSDCSVWTLTE